MSTRDASEKGGELAKVVSSGRPYYQQVLPSHMRIDTFLQLAQGYLKRPGKEADRLRQVFAQNPHDGMRALRKCAYLGLVPGETFHLLPFGGKNPTIVGVTDYKGEIELIMRSAGVSSVRARVVYKNDKFDYDPASLEAPRHVPAGGWFATEKDRGDPVGAYAYAVMPDGRCSQVIVMSREEIEKIRDASPMWRKADQEQRATSTWTVWWDRMWIKTAVHQLHKWVPTSVEVITPSVTATQEPRPAPAVTDFVPPPLALEEESGDVVEGDVVEDNPGFGGPREG